MEKLLDFSIYSIMPLSRFCLSKKKSMSPAFFSSFTSNFSMILMFLEELLKGLSFIWFIMFKEFFFWGWNPFQDFDNKAVGSYSLP